MNCEKIEFSYAQKLELAEWIAYENSGAVTGSIMLRERGIELGREPNDIDIIVDDMSPDDIVLPPLCTKKEIEQNDDGYDVLARCYFLGLKIEFITDAEELRKSSNIGFKLNCKFASIDGLLKAKKMYIENDIEKLYIEKTKRDIEIIESHLNKTAAEANDTDNGRKRQ